MKRLTKAQARNACEYQDLAAWWSILAMRNIQNKFLDVAIMCQRNSARNYATAREIMRIEE
jgi:hypothetical protein